MRGLQAAFVGLILVAVAGEASNTYTFSGTAGGIAEDASATFSLTNCGTTTCTLDILLTNLDTSPTTIAQGIIGLSFNIGSMTSAGTLVTNSGGVAEINNGDGGQVESISYAMNPVTLTPTSLAPGWSFGYSTGSAKGCTSSNVFCLNGLPGGQPNDLILGGGPYSGGGSLSSHTPDLDGGTNGTTYLGVEFQIINVPISIETTALSNVVFDFGTAPDGVGAACNNTATCGGIIQSTPEPVSIALTGGGLIALALLRRRISLGRR